MHTMTIALHAALACVFVSSATAKGMRRAEFAHYLSIPFGRLANYVALLTIAAEFLIAATGLVPSFSRWWPWLVISAVLMFTVFYSIRLNLSDDTACACWGRDTASRRSGDDRPLWRRALAPGILGARNLLLVVAALLASGPASSRQLAADVLIGASCLLIVATGLAVSVMVTLARGGGEWMEEYAARWRYLGQGRCQVASPGHAQGRENGVADIRLADLRTHA